jgi:hypothetical protein
LSSQFSLRDYGCLTKILFFLLLSTEKHQISVSRARFSLLLGFANIFMGSRVGGRQQPSADRSKKNEEYMPAKV